MIRQAVEQDAATRLQARVRGQLARRQFREAATRQRSVIQIQAQARRYNARLIFRALMEEAKIRTNAVRIQAAFRAYRARKHFTLMVEEAETLSRNMAVTRIQACVRRQIARTRVIRILEERAAKVIQAIARGYIWRTFLARMIKEIDRINRQEGDVLVQEKLPSRIVRTIFGDGQQEQDKMQHPAKCSPSKVRRSLMHPEYACREPYSWPIKWSTKEHY